MKKNILNDERVINEKRKITNEAFSLIMLILISSILVQQFVFKAHFSEYATEFICFFGALIYILIRNISVGNKIINDVKMASPMGSYFLCIADNRLLILTVKAWFDIIICISLL